MLGGIIDSLLFNGANSRILLRVANGQLIEIADPSAASTVRQGDAVALSWQPERARIFARRTA